jgi:septal ring factor EnvC (AmiA/AmiB activator)
MNRCTLHSCLLVACLVLGANAFGGAAETADSADAKAKLAEVRSRISALTLRLGAQLKDRDAIAARLREADLKLTAARQQLEALRSAQATAERHRAELRVEAARTQGALDAQRGVLAAQVRAAYMMGQQEQLKILLNQTDPAAAGRTMAFYGYFARERTAKIDEIRARAARVQELVAQIEDAGEKLQMLQADTLRQMGDLQRIRGERVAALDAVTRQLSSGSEELAQLQREERAKEALLADLARVLQDFPVDSQQSFEALRGKLPWPVSGSLGQDSRSRNGVQIEAARGAKVRAPYSGRVVYADWLQGLGLLLIIGHSGNYMTLYGHAEVLYKSVGDWVAPGDVIAAMSDSAGVAPQLYFEIRNGRKAVDAKVWLKASP